MRQNENARVGGRLHWSLLGLGAVLGGTFGVFPRDAGDFRAADADIGELTVAQTGKFPQTGVIGAPLTEETEEAGEQHDYHPFDWTAEVRNESERKISRYGALQKILCCGAAMRECHNEGHNFLKSYLIQT